MSALRERPRVTAVNDGELRNVNQALEGEA